MRDDVGFEVIGRHEGQGSNDVTETVGNRSAQSLGDLLRQWRKRRFLSQLELAAKAEISPRHLSFVENGRSTPSRDTVLRLAGGLGLDLRERNSLLLAAGYAPVYNESSLDSPRMAAVREMVRWILAAHEPFPAIVLDRYWRRIHANRPALMFRDGVSAELLKEPVNLLRLSLHPDGLARRIANLGEWRAHLLSRLHHQVTMTADANLIKLYDELIGYPCDQPEPRIELPSPGEIAVPLRIWYEGKELAFLSTMATFGTPLDITTAELSIECFYPADSETEELLRRTEW